ncbi:MAG: D-aminoacyl-tRNA deacylase [Thermoanaerobaculia bacterium]
MICLIQRVKEASVKIEGKEISSVSYGMLIFIGFEKGDREEVFDKAIEKILNLRIFDDSEGKLNKSILEIKGEILLVSQFTLAADIKRGRRPSFDNALEPEKSVIYFEKFYEKLKESKIKVEKGVFGAKMEIYLINDGPVTIIGKWKGI